MQDEGTHRAIIRLFADDSSAPFSIHKIVEIGQDTIKCKPGDWFGPGSTAHLLKQALHSAQFTLQNRSHSDKNILDWSYVNLISSLKIYVATDGTVYKQDVRDICDNGARSKLNQCDDLDTDMTDMGASSLDKEGGFSFLDRPDGLMSRCSKTEGSINENDGQIKHKNIERKVSGGFAYLDGSEARSVNAATNSHDDSYDSVTEAVLLDDGIIRQYSLSQQVSVDGETWMTEEYLASASQTVSTPISTNISDRSTQGILNRKSNAMHSPSVWSPVLLLIPVRLGGGEKLNPIYAECVRSLLANENSVGIIGKALVWGIISG